MLVPEIVAKNCCVLRIALDGARNAYAGEIATATGPDATAIVTTAAPLFDGSAWLVARSVTGLGAGADDGAM